MKSKATIFIFKDYRVSLRNRTIIFSYQQLFSNRDALDFKETIALPDSLDKINRSILDKFLEPLHLILGISYYKLYCSSQISIPYKLSQEQADFWNIVYKKGLGEFLYRNHLDPKRVAQFPYSNTRPQPLQVKVKDRLLLGIGGGKDSIVAAEILKKNFEVHTFLLETQRNDQIARSVIKAVNLPSLVIKRELDPQLFAKHEGSYNGHIPISAIYAFSGLLLAALYGYKSVVVGNAHSSDFGNLYYKGLEINHQWSKSIEFEQLLQDYIRKFITPDITYFSVLRQFYELRVAELLAQSKKYFAVFTSCNKNFRIIRERPKAKWCCECPKCAFVFLLLAPFLKPNELIKIFGKNFFEEQSLIATYADILGFGKLKPFDCVGPFEEARAALNLAAENFKNSLIIKTFLPKTKISRTETEKILRTVPAPTLPTPFRFLGIKNVAILGYGKEGQVTEKYLKRYDPHLEIGILDQKFDPNYLAKQEDYDLVIKTPGIPLSKVTRPYATATNIFFSKVKNTTIGVTGSKGKSTTTSLIYDILKTAGKKVRLLGNIGNPMLELLLDKVDPKEIFVIELSSYMLEDIEYSPNIALLINLFPEHMDYHGTVEDYYHAKKNIFRFQKPADIALKPPFMEKIPLDRKEIPLIGDHNLENIKAAIKVAHIFKIDDKTIGKAIKNFKPLPHRLEYVGTFQGIKFYDDAISTTPQSTIAAIKALKDVDTIFLGGEDRGYDFRNLEEILQRYKIRNIVLFPDSGNRILKSKKELNILKTRDMKEAVTFAFANTQKNKICLLSTASPSYSLWKNFEEKGDLFQKFVRS